MDNTNEIKATYYGAGLLFLSIIVFFIIPQFTVDPIVSFFTYATLGIFKLGSVFYGLTLVKKLKRDYSTWRFFIFFLTSFSLIILGLLNKLKKDPIIIKLDPGSDSKNLNNLPNITLGTNSNLLLESIRCDSFTLQHMINNYSEYIKDYSQLFPILAAYQLNKLNVIFDQKIEYSLENFAKDNHEISFKEMLNNLSLLSIGEICEKYN